jgi:hypothetical protein
MTLKIMFEHFTYGSNQTGILWLLVDLKPKKKKKILIARFGERS